MTTMQYIKYLILSLGLITYAHNANAQSYTTESKSCGSCSKSVSNNSKVGMTCPHCGVRWGYENESKNYSNNSYNYSNNYNPTPSKGHTFGNTCQSYSRVNLRENPSTRSRKLTTIPALTSVTIIQKLDNWYKVKYTYYNNYGQYVYLTGYVYKKLFQ